MEAKEITTDLRLKMPAFWLVCLFLLAIFLPSKVWTSLLIGIGGLFGISYAWARGLAGGIRANRRLKYGWVGVGDRLVEEFEVRKLGIMPALWIEIQDDSNVPGYDARLVRGLDNNYIRWHQEAVCEQRGQFRLGPWRIVGGDPFGIFVVTHHFPISDEIIIHPPIYTNIPVALPPGQSSGQVRARDRALQATINAATVRPYQVTDPYRWIHWRKTAQTDTLQVRQFDLDAAGDIWLLLDLEEKWQLGAGGDSTEEQAVILAASLVAEALGKNRAIGLAGYGQTPQLVPPSQGEGQQWRLLRALALVTANGETSVDVAIRDVGKLVKRGSAVAIITANGGLDWMPAFPPLLARGVRVSVILLDRESYGEPTSTTPIVQAQIHKLGIQTHLVRQGDIGTPTESHQANDWEFRVTRTGKVFTLNRPQ